MERSTAQIGECHADKVVFRDPMPYLDDQVEQNMDEFHPVAEIAHVLAAGRPEQSDDSQNQVFCCVNVAGLSRAILQITMDGIQSAAGYTRYMKEEIGRWGRLSSSRSPDREGSGRRWPLSASQVCEKELLLSKYV